MTQDRKFINTLKIYLVYPALYLPLLFSVFYFSTQNSTQPAIAYQKPEYPFDFLRNERIERIDLSQTNNQPPKQTKQIEPTETVRTGGDSIILLTLFTSIVIVYYYTKTKTNKSNKIKVDS